VWLSWGPVLSRIVISPAQHQIHHSRAPEHFNRNFGSQFALWDWMFGTLSVPERREKLELGISPAETERLRAVAALYLQPFRDAWAVVRRSRAGRAQKRYRPPGLSALRHAPRRPPAARPLHPAMTPRFPNPAEAATGPAVTGRILAPGTVNTVSIPSANALFR